MAWYDYAKYAFPVAAIPTMAAAERVPQAREWLHRKLGPQGAGDEARLERRPYYEEQYEQFRQSAVPQAEVPGEFRQRQMTLADELAAVGRGERMGAGEMAAQRAGRLGQAAVASQAAGARGMGANLAAREAMRQSARLTTDIAGRGAEAAAADQQRAQAALGAVLGQGRGQDLQTSLANLQALMQGRSQWLQALAQQTGMSETELMARLQSQDPGIAAAILQAGAAALPGAVAASDARVKRNIKEIPAGKVHSNSGLAEMLESLRPVTYRYTKDAPAGNDKRATHRGIIAQDLEKTRAGRDMTLNIGGVKHIDVSKGFGHVLAAVVDQHKRLKELEERRSQRSESS